jgi:hypothetical protein
MNNKRFSNSSKELSNLFNIYRLHQIIPITQLLWPKDQDQKTKNRTTHTLKYTSIKENNWISYNNNEDGVSHTQQYCDIKRIHRFSVNMFPIVNNDNTALNT